MRFPAPSKLFFSAGLLALVMVAIEFRGRGPEVRTLLGLVLASAWLTIGYRIRRDVA